MVNDGGAVAAWAEALAGWHGEGRVTTVVPSHGRVGGRELLAATVAYLRGLRAGECPRDMAVLSPFYRETHERNVQMVGAAAGSRRVSASRDTTVREGSTSRNARRGGIVQEPERRELSVRPKRPTATPRARDRADR